MYHYTTNNDRVLVLTARGGKRRTIRTSQIVDLIEEDAENTIVEYVGGKRIYIAAPFDELHQLWIGGTETESWRGA